MARLAALHHRLGREQAADRAADVGGDRDVGHEEVEHQVDEEQRAETGVPEPHALTLHHERGRGRDAEHAARCAGSGYVWLRDQRAEPSPRAPTPVQHREAHWSGARFEDLADDPQQQHVERDVHDADVHERARVEAPPLALVHERPVEHELVRPRPARVVAVVVQRDEEVHADGDPDDRLCRDEVLAAQLALQPLGRGGAAFAYTVDAVRTDRRLLQAIRARGTAAARAPATGGPVGVAVARGRRVRGHCRSTVPVRSAPAQTRIRRRSGGRGSAAATHLILTSTATAPAADTMTGLQSISATSGNIVGEAPDPQEQVLERGDVDPRAARGSRRSSGEPRSDRTSRARVGVGERQDAQCAVGEQLGGDAADAEQHERPERRVLGDADDRLDAAPRPSAARSRRPSSSPSACCIVGERGAHRRRRRQGRARRRRRRSCARSRANPPSTHGVAELVGGAHRGLGRVDEP